MLVTLFFWRPLELEGGAALIRALVAAAPPEVELRLLLPRPLAGLGLPAGSVVPFAARTRLGTLVRYLRLLRREAKRADALVLLENNPAFHLLTSPWVPRLERAAVCLVSPCLESERRRLSRQWLAHRLAKSAATARWAGRLLGHRAARYLVSTRFQAQQLARLGFPAERTRTIAFGSGLAAPAAAGTERPAADGRRLVVGYLGHFSPVKGVPDLVEAVYRLLDDGVPIELRVAWSGRGAEAPAVLDRLARPPVPDAVSLAGEVDVAAFLAGLDLLVLPMRNESFPHPPLVLVEALAVGTPVLASDAGGLPDLLAAGPFGATFPRHDPAALADLLRRLAADRAPLDAWRRNVAHQAARVFDNRALWRALLAPLGTAAAGAAAGALEPLERAR